MTLSLILCTALLLGRVHAQCPTACFCTSDVIDCSNLNLNELPVGTTPSSFDRLSRLDYSNNGISVLDIDRLFQFIRGLEVDVIDFSSNRISDVIGTFDANDGKDYLVLNLSRNVLQTFPSSIIPLNHIRGMITIDISHNQLTELTRNMFAGGNDVILPRFQFFATNNLISRVDPETFQGVSILDAIVDLRSNLIRTLTEDFQSPRSVRQLRFSDNPWHCDCNLRWIITPANRLVNHTMDDPPACRTPAAVQGRRIFELRPDDFACLPFQDGPLRQNYLNMDSFLVRCPVNADPPRFQVDWQVWIPSPFGLDPIQLFFTSETVGLRDLVANPRAAFKCTARNNAGSLTLSLDIQFNGEPGLPVPECPAVIAPDQC
ncbi:leucine-rich repeat and fibronectin type-III domain-containing protein 4-like [Apostichopus japonicus]|uniref:leucine-rich repeat and fibronectin type-III domain-containing protein 4-like n=1 Tax=Stichopus japonicus TaxID=307972 RepID=UPI003AB48432